MTPDPTANSLPPYISGGRLSGNTCLTCDNRYPDPSTWSHGWCILRDYASVSSTGYCELHSSTQEDTQP